MDEKNKQYSKIGWWIIAVALIVILIFLPVIAAQLGSSLFFIEILSAVGILVISGWYLFRRRA